MGKQDRLLGYPWSGLGWYLAAPADRPAWMRVDRLLGEHGSSEDTAEARRVFERRTEARRAPENDEAQWEPVRRGWCLGGEGFRQGLLERIEGKLGEHHAGQLRAESAAAKAERIIGEELQRVGWTRADLEKRKRIAPGEVETGGKIAPGNDTDDQPHYRITQRLHLGSWKSATTRLHSLKRKREQQGTPSLL